MLNFIVTTQIGPFGQNTIDIFALHKCGDSRDLAVSRASRLPFDGDFGVAKRDHAEQQGAAKSADGSPQRHEGEEHQRPARAFKTGGFCDFDPGEPGGKPESGAAQCAQYQPEHAQQRDFHSY